MGIGRPRGKCQVNGGWQALREFTSATLVCGCSERSTETRVSGWVDSRQQRSRIPDEGFFADAWGRRKHDVPAVGPDAHPVRTHVLLNGGAPARLTILCRCAGGVSHAPKDTGSLLED